VIKQHGYLQQETAALPFVEHSRNFGGNNLFALGLASPEKNQSAMKLNKKANLSLSFLSSFLMLPDLQSERISLYNLVV